MGGGNGDLFDDYEQQPDATIGDLSFEINFSEEGFSSWELRDRFLVSVTFLVKNNSSTHSHSVSGVMNLPENVNLRREDGSFDLGTIAPNSEICVSFEIYLFRSFAYRTLYLDFDITTQSQTKELSFSYLIPADERGMRLAGRELEFFTIIPVTTQPVISEIVIEPISGVDGAYIIRISDFYTFSDMTPYFFWRTAEGTFLEASSDSNTVEFRADVGTGGRRIPLIVGLGDREGSVVRATIWVDGRH
jgi:hypothetical protein